MYRVGEYVIYGKSGVCKVLAIGRLQMSGIDASRLYYTLKPVYTADTIYTPVDTDVFMRPAITRQQALGLIEQIPSIEQAMQPQHDLGSRELPEYYRSLMESHDCEDIVRLIITIYQRAREAQLNKRKTCQTDQNFMREAEETLYGELAVALNVPIQTVPELIRRMVQPATEDGGTRGV